MIQQEKVLLAFPGQGSQSLGMAVGWQASAAARAVLAEANEALGLDLGRLMAPEAEAEVLTQTANAQPALLTVGLMAAACLAEQAGKQLKDIAALVAGHSLGEYTAVAAAGGMGVTQAVRLVRARGDAMAQAGAASGGMSAVLGLEITLLETVLASHLGVVLANDNCLGQAVIAGPLAALPAAEEACKAAGAKRVLRLGVGGAFHTPAQGAAAARVAAALAAEPVGVLRLPCLMNYTAQITVNKTEVAYNLIQQITHRVRWRESTVTAAEGGITEVLELGCGKVLAGLAPRCDSRLNGVSLTTYEEVCRWLEGQEAG